MAALMMAGVLLYLGIAKDYEPLLLLPIGAGFSIRPRAAASSRASGMPSNRAQMAPTAAALARVN